MLIDQGEGEGRGERGEGENISWLPSLCVPDLGSNLHAKYVLGSVLNTFGEEK